MKNCFSQETLRRRQQAFKKTEEEIEARLAEEEQEMKRQEEHIYEQQKNHIGNSSGRNSGMFQRIIKFNFVLFVNVISKRHIL